MKSTNKKVLLILIGLLTVMMLLAACDKKEPAPTPSTDTEGEVTTSAPSVETTAPSEETTAPEDVETEAPETLSSDEVIEIFNQALLATDEQTASKDVIIFHAAAMGKDIGTTKMTQIVDGDNRVYEEEVDGIFASATFIGDKVYFSETYENGTEKSVVTLTDAQRAWALSFYENNDTDPSKEMRVDQFIGLEGVKNPDGSVRMTATALSDDLTSTMLASSEDAGFTDMKMTVKNCVLTISAKGLMESMALDVAINAKMEQDGISMDIAMTMEFSVTAEYENISITVPADAENYVADSFEHYFMFTPSEEEAELMGLPLDQNSYTIGEEGSQVSADDQFMGLATYPSAYENNTFVIYGVVSQDEELGVNVINAGEYGTFYFYCPSGVTAPVYGDTVKITATFERTADKGFDSDYLCFTFMVSECEVLARGVGPNGGRIMFVTASSLNVRTSSDTSSNANVLGTLSQGDAVEVFDQDEKGWWRIEFKGQTAYISNKYVSETRP